MMDQFVRFQACGYGFPFESAITPGAFEEQQHPQETMRTNLHVRDPRKEFKLPPIRTPPGRSDDSPKLPLEELDTEFKRKYPPEAQLGTELDDGARVWKVYRDEATEHDTRRLEGWNNTVNILLTFAGLFSATVTAFVIDSYNLLQTDDSQQYAARALYALVLATNNSAAVSLVPPPPTLSQSPATLPRWINGLWFSSLFLALTAALLCILVKQWLDEYTARTRASSKNMRHWARRHAFYSKGMEEWSVSAIISLLPLLLHLALFLFFAGIAVLLWNLDRVIAGTLAAFALLLFGAYIICTVLPLWHPACPFSTPLLNQIRSAWITSCILALDRYITVHQSALDFYDSTCALQPRMRPYVVFIPQRMQRTLRAVWGRVRHAVGSSNEAAANDRMSSNNSDDQLPYRWLVLRLEHILSRLRQAKPGSAFDRLLSTQSGATIADIADSAALHWLVISVSDTDANAVGLQALGALHPDSPLAERMRTNEILSIADTSDNVLTRTASAACSATEVARFLRCQLLLRPGYTDMYLWPEFPASVLDVIEGSDYPDMVLLHAARRSFYRRVPARVTTRSPTSTSTAMLLLRHDTHSVRHLVYYLLACDLDVLTRSDWDRVFAVLHVHVGPCLLPHLRRQRCTAVCLAEALSQLIVKGHTHLTAVDLTEAVVQLLGRVLAVTDNRDVAAGSNLAGIRLSHMPHFLEYMSSPHSGTQGYDNQALDVMRHILGDPWRWDLQDAEMARKASRALSHLLHLLANSRDRRHDTLFVDAQYLSKTLAFLVRDPADAHQCWTVLDFPQGSAPVVLRVHDVLLPTEPGGIVIWSAFSHTCGLHDNRGLHAHLLLATALAFALCTFVRQGGDVHTERMVNTFLADVSLPALVQQVVKERHIKITVQRFVLLAQHCLELRPSWWSTGVEILAREGRDNDAEEFVLAMRNRLAVMGRCNKCPKRRRSDTSVCSFDPSV